VAESLRGQLLIATPSLFDHFRRSVVLLIDHTEEGAMGVMLGRPSEASVADAVPALADLAGEDTIVHLGGPVSPESVVVVADFEDPDEAGVRIVATVGTLDPEHLDVRVRRLRVYAGYAGWGPGQLEAEIEAEAWIIEPASPEDAFADGDVWATTLQRKGGKYALLATMPVDPSQN
jgi:putative transcriptional regulator